ncbi:hypothetical protein [Jiella pelagia]|uniref:DUF6950 domain-containing protein n=1 Tax=Jiella pelagia TaxID=2986949 RepID=A0ABY7BU04_9HYPH|nr:hypothetical protein [Jiella pelagia]WAP67237.1 hypothetical protein OH818_16810 [Jiella pelagia]
MTLTEFIRGEIAKPFDLATNNCAHFIARWVADKRDRDLLAVFGGLPIETTEDLLARHQMLRTIMICCRSIGLARTSEPSEGDIATVRCGGRHRCAIRSANGWVFLDECGVLFVSPKMVKPLMCWSV